MGESSSSKDTETYGGEKILNLASNGLGLAIGKMSMQQGLECSWDAQFYGDVNISKSINIDGSGTIDGTLIVSNDITAYGNIAAHGDLSANTITLSVLHGSVEGAYVKTNSVTTQNIYMSGKLYQSTSQGDKFIYGINSYDNLQIGAPGSSAYDNAALYAPGNIYLVPGGSQLDNDGWTVVVRNYLDENDELKRGVNVNGNISCDGYMYINNKRVLTVDDLDENSETAEINNSHYHSGRTLKCIGITPKEINGKTSVDTFTMDAELDVKGRTIAHKAVVPYANNSVALGMVNSSETLRWSTVYAVNANMTGDIKLTGDVVDTDGNVKYMKAGELGNVVAVFGE
jgi:hypothetical protein